MTITGVILAGGLARRMNQQDKGLLLYRGQPLVNYAINALSPLVTQLFISANRHTDVYSQFGYQVLVDKNQSFDGPLAGILTALSVCQSPVLVVMPCDSPLIKTCHLQKLITGLDNESADIAVAFDGQRQHNVFLALKTTLQSSLAAYLASGERKIDSWLTQQRLTQVDFSQEKAVFANINTPADLTALSDSED